MNQKNCPRPDQNPTDEVCEFASQLFLQALDGYSPESLEFAKNQLQQCGSCLGVLELQVQLRQVMTVQLRTSAPKNLRIEISENLKRMSLGQLEITDFAPINISPPKKSGRKPPKIKE